MKRKIKAIILALLMIASLAVLTGCGEEPSAYEKNNQEGYTVSVKFDANGGVFTTNTSVIVDSFNPTENAKDANGNPQIALIAPDNSLRGNDAFTPVKNGYFLAGWYAEKTETIGADGQTETVYGDKWDFEKDLLTLDPSKEYSAEEPVLTLYAAWVPMFEYEFYSMTDGSLIGTYTYDPTTAQGLKVPSWDEKSGAIEMYHFPQVKGYTFDGVYLDAEGTMQVTEETIKHSGEVDLTNAMAKNPTMKLYVDYKEGEWFHIYNVDQFVKNASVNGCYEIHADLDFSEAIWPTSLMYGNFAGKINGNGHTFSNIQAKQTNNSKVNAGLFGSITEQAEIRDLTITNASFTIQAGTRVAGTSYGLLAGTIADAATFANVKIADSVLKIDSKCYFGVSDYSIGLLCGMGSNSQITFADGDIRCEATGDHPEQVQITVNGNRVTVEIVTP